MQHYTGTVSKGFGIEPMTGHILLDSGVRYHAENGREIPIKMSLSGYAYSLVRTFDGESVAVADILEYREIDRFEPMKIRPASVDSAKVILADLSGLSVDVSTMRSELPDRPVPGSFVVVTPPMLCLIVWECKRIADEVIEDVKDGILAYRTPKTELARWTNLKVPSGYMPYMKESVMRVVEIAAQEGIAASDIVFANIWGGAPDFTRDLADADGHSRLMD